ncbi:MAG: FAD:protein FMN transferase [Planctomycetes bacterium]|nr:FAD:protein FMN transferase [Planctomycetota bacterium]
MSTRRSSAAWPLSFLLLAGCSEPVVPEAKGPTQDAKEPVVHEFAGLTMGSTYQVKFVGDTPLATVRAAVEEELAAIDLAFSQWRPDSEIARVNAHRSTAPLPLSPRFAAVLDEALRFAVATEGAFDPTVRPLSVLYRDAKRTSRPIDPAALAAAKARVDHRAVAVRDGMLCKQRADVELDLDGLVAGAACDAIAARLVALGVSGFYLDVTGEVLCHGEKGPGQPWRIGVVDPRSDAFGGQAPTRIVELLDRSLCTSGDYRNALVLDGDVVHHVFDPRTGHNAPHRVVSASILARRGSVADALGTACLVLGEAGVRAQWPALRALGAQGALLLAVDERGRLVATEFDWPPEPR